MAVKNGESHTLGSVFLGLRKTSGLTRNELATLAGVGKTTIFDIENDKRTVQLANVLKVAKVLNLSIVLRSPLDEEWQLDL